MIGSNSTSCILTQCGLFGIVLALNISQQIIQDQMVEMCELRVNKGIRTYRHFPKLQKRTSMQFDAEQKGPKTEGYSNKRGETVPITRIAEEDRAVKVSDKPAS